MQRCMLLGGPLDGAEMVIQPGQDVIKVRPSIPFNAFDDTDDLTVVAWHVYIRRLTEFGVRFVYEGLQDT